jgi:hypothetical protein
MAAALESQRNQGLAVRWLRSRLLVPAARCLHPRPAGGAHVARLRPCAHADPSLLVAAHAAEEEALRLKGLMAAGLPLRSAFA